MRAIRLRIEDEDGTVYDDQVAALSIVDPAHLIKSGMIAAPLYVARIAASRTEIEAELGFPLTPSGGS